MEHEDDLNNRRVGVHAVHESLLLVDDELADRHRAGRCTIARWSDVKGTTFEAGDGVGVVPYAALVQRGSVPLG